MAEYRLERLGNLIREQIGGLILEGKIKDPRVTPFLSITRVAVSRDLAYAEVYVSNIRGGASRGVGGLQNAAGFIQARLARSMRVRKTPKLRFHEDTGIREGFAILKKIETLVHSDEGGESGADES
jgi:ribosome-binding factor A